MSSSLARALEELPRLRCSGSQTLECKLESSSNSTVPDCPTWAMHLSSRSRLPEPVSKPDHPHFLQAMKLGQEVALLLDCTSWCGAGPGLMDAATKGALEAGKPVGVFRIHNEGGVWTNTLSHPYMVSGTYLTCRGIPSLQLDSSRRESSTAFLALPGSVGSMDEIFEVLTLIQLRRIGSSFPVPFLLINYDGFYYHLLEFLATCREWGTVAEGEVEALWRVCRNNSEALDYLAEFYSISHRK